MSSERPGKPESRNKRRRKRARTEDFSSDSSSSSESSDQEIIENESDSDQNETLNMDIDMKNDADNEEEYIYRNEKLKIPKELDVSEPIDDKFQEYYRQLMTKEFGDDLNELQKSQDFQDTSLFLLVKALEKGANIFDETQRKEIMKGKERDVERDAERGEE